MRGRKLAPLSQILDNLRAGKALYGDEVLDEHELLLDVAHLGTGIALRGAYNRSGKKVERTFRAFPYQNPGILTFQFVGRDDNPIHTAVTVFRKSEETWLCNGILAPVQIARGYDDRTPHSLWRYGPVDRPRLLQHVYSKQEFTGVKLSLTSDQTLETYLREMKHIPTGSPRESQ